MRNRRGLLQVYFGTLPRLTLRGRGADAINSAPFSFGASMANQNSFAFQYVVTASAVALAANQVFNTVTFAAKSTNTGSVYLGFSSTVDSTHGYILEKGTSVTLRIANTDQVYVIGTASDVLSVIGS